MLSLLTANRPWVERIGESPRRGFLALASAVFFARKLRELYGPSLDRGKAHAPATGT